MPSSVIASIDYQSDHARLTVVFTTGRIYEYYLVPPSLAAAFQTAFSKGTFFNTQIRDHFAYREIAPDQPKRSAL